MLSPRARSPSCILVSAPGRLVMVLFWTLLVVAITVLAGDFTPWLVLTVLIATLVGMWCLMPGSFKTTRFSGAGSLGAIALGRNRDQCAIPIVQIRGIDLDAYAGSTTGILGPNSSGKSTLLKMIGGIIQPTSGTVDRRGRLAALLELGAGFHPDLTGRENFFLNASILGLSRRQIELYFDAIVDFSGIGRFIDTQVKFYSSGMYVRLAFAVAVHVDPDVLLVDEVLAVGDEPFQRKCMDRIREFQLDGRTIVLVSHSLGQVGELCDRAVVLKEGQIVADDTPNVAMRVLREGFETTRQQEEAEHAAAVEPAPALATVVSVETTDAGGAPLSEFTSGDALRIVVTYQADRSLDDWRAGIRIESTLAQVVFGTNTILTGVELPVLRGRRQVVFTIPELRLVTGQYFVAGAIGHRDGRPIHQLQQGALFSVTSDGTAFGLADMRPSIVAI